MKLAGDKCVTGKTGWSYCYEAMTRLQAIIAEKDGRPKPFRVYRCEFCSNYHLTSHEDRREIAVNPFKFERHG